MKIMYKKIFNKFKSIYIEKPGENFLKEKNFLALYIFNDPFSILIVRIMQKLNLMISPNLISIISFFFTLLAAYFFFFNKLINGAFCYFIYFILDGVDGKWARLTNNTSKLGAIIDNSIHIFGDFFMYIGLWYSQYYLNNLWITGAIIISLHYLIVLIVNLFMIENNYKTIFSKVYSYYTGFEEVFITFFFATLFNIVNMLFPFSVILHLILLIILIYKQRKNLKFNNKIIESLFKI